MYAGAEEQKCMKQEGQLGRKKASLVVLLAQQHKEHLLAVERNDYLHVKK